VGSKQDRQRALARAKAERQLARRAAMARRRRRWQAAVTGIIALAVIGTGTAWATGAFDEPPPVPADCNWLAVTDTTNPDIKDVGTPPTHDIPKSGTKLMKISTNHGVIEAQLDLKRAACAAASFEYLAKKKFFDNTKCHKLSTSGVYTLQCGDPAGTDKGGPSYTFSDENLPSPEPTPSGSVDPSADPSASPPPSADPSASASASPKAVNYPRGSLVLRNSGSPGTNGSQFFIVYQDSPDLGASYTTFGHVTSGLDVVEKIAAGGVEEIQGQEAIGGKPKIEVVVQSLTVGKRQSGDLGPTPSLPPASASVSGAPDSASPSGSA
jgi:peptidyl-prolyl cis-trans isomerase B (cyclophilin B)